MSTRVALFLSDASLFESRGRLLQDVARVLDRRGYTVDVLLFAPPAELRESLPASIRVVDVSSPWLRFRAPGNHKAKGVYLSLPKVAAYLRRARPAALLGGCIPPNVVALAAKRLARVDTRIVVRQCNIVRIAGDPDYGHVLWRGRDPLVRWFYRHASGIVAVSAGVADNTARVTGVSPARMRIVYPGVTADAAARGREPLDHPWFHDGGAPVILNVARYTPKKDHGTLLRAFARLRATRPARLVLLGQDGPSRPAIERTIAELGLGDVVDVAGYDPNPFRYMARADVLVLSSLSEGNPNVLWEAMACGCPVVSTDCPSGPRELLGEDGTVGRLVPVQDASALASAIGATLDDPPPPGALRARTDAFPVGSAAESYADVVAYWAATPEPADQGSLAAPV
jgi:glycosyltransferase involved in cell wall biosynthesis